MVTDPIADFLTRIRNAQMANHRIVEIPASNLKKRMKSTACTLLSGKRYPRPMRSSPQSRTNGTNNSPLSQ